MQQGWNLDRSMWQRLSSALDPSAHWKCVPFHESSLASVPQKPGVYLIVGRPPTLGVKPHSNFSKPLYIGRSESNLRARFRSHCAGTYQQSLRTIHKCYSGNEELVFWYAALPAFKVAELESLLIDCYGPPANQISGIRVRFRDPVPAG